MRALAAARGDAPADLLLTGGRVFVPPTREWLETDLAICDGVVVGWGCTNCFGADGFGLCSLGATTLNVGSVCD